MTRRRGVGILHVGRLLGRRKADTVPRWSQQVDRAAHPVGHDDDHDNNEQQEQKREEPVEGDTAPEGNHHGDGDDEAAGGRPTRQLLPDPRIHVLSLRR